MVFGDKAVVITGAGGGIGAALALRFAREHPRVVVAADINAVRAEQTARQVRARAVPALAVAADVSDPEQVHKLIAEVENGYGQVDIVCSNAGVAAGMGVHAPDSRWASSWGVNVMAHVYLAKAVLPGMAARRSGTFLITASAAGLLGLPGDAPYTVTKHAAVGLADWLATTYGRNDVQVSVLCPLGVRTDFLMPAVAAGHPAARAVAEYAPIIEPDEVAEAALRGMADGRFMILPHPEVAEMYAKKAADPQAWQAAQQRDAQ